MGRRLQETHNEDGDEDVVVDSVVDTHSLPLAQAADSTETRITTIERKKEIDVDDEDHLSPTDVLSPMSTGSDKHDEIDHRLLVGEMGTTPSPTYDFSNIRVCVLRLRSSDRH